MVFSFDMDPLQTPPPLEFWHLSKFFWFFFLKASLTQSAFAFSDDVLIPDFLMAGLAVEPGSENKCKCQLKVGRFIAC